MAVYIGLTILVVAATASLDEAAQTAISLSLFLLTLVGGPIAVETLSHGRSLGKLACGLRVVRDDGGPVRFRHALVRGLIGVIEILMTLGVVACIASLVSARGRRLGDVFAGTIVVRERVPGVAGRPLLGAGSRGGAGQSAAGRPAAPGPDAAARSAGGLVDGGAAGGGCRGAHGDAGAAGRAACGLSRRDPAGAAGPGGPAG